MEQIQILLIIVIFLSLFLASLQDVFCDKNISILLLIISFISTCLLSIESCYYAFLGTGGAFMFKLLIEYISSSEQLGEADLPVIGIILGLFHQNINYFIYSMLISLFSAMLLYIYFRYVKKQELIPFIPSLFLGSLLYFFV